MSPSSLGGGEISKRGQKSPQLSKSKRERERETREH